MTKEIEYSLIVRKIHIDTRLTQCSQAQKHEWYAEEEVAN